MATKPAKYPGYRTMTSAERRNARMARIFDDAYARAHAQGKASPWDTKEGPDPTTRPRMRDHRPAFSLCGCCDHWHRAGFTGDCRDNDQRFTTGQLDVLFPDVNGDGWPDWIEVDVEEKGKV